MSMHGMSSQEKCYYLTLGLTHDAQQPEIRKAYLTLALTQHPDKSLDEQATQNFQQLLEAYEALRCPEQRREYTCTVLEHQPAWYAWCPLLFFNCFSAFANAREE